MNDEQSVTQLLQRLQNANCDSAAQEIWLRFINRVVRIANAKLRGLPRRAADEDDVAQSAFNAFFRGVKTHRFKQMNDRNDLWQVLIMLTERKATQILRRELAQKRGGGTVRGESVFNDALADSSRSPGLANMADSNPEWAEPFVVEVRQMLEMLDPTMQRIALLRLEGKKNPEIASTVGLTLRSTERKVRLIKDKWLAELGDC